jgi:hypothetical protein
MGHSRRPDSSACFFALLIAVCLTIASVAGQVPASSAKRGSASGRWTAPRTVDGQPDLQGVWANNGVTPLERPEAFKGRATMTDAELEQLKKRAVDLYRGKQAGDILGDRLIQEILKDPDLRPFDADTGNYNSFWVVDRDWDNRTSLITDPADGRIPPLTEQAKGSRRERQGPSGPPAGPQDVSLSVRCITYGVPRISAGYNSYFEIRQSAGYVTITQEMIHDVRVIPLDGRPHVGKNIRLWNGDSRGRWEGDTLVVDTTNYSTSGAIRGATQNLHLIERFTRVSPETIEYSITFDDPAIWTKPWTAMIRLKGTPDKIYEYACHEGNESIVGILAGARAQEKTPASGNSGPK